jgi:hypothetical protein
MKFWCSPTGLGLRSDPKGDGSFGAKRGDRIHLGVDFLAVVGQGVVAPVDAQYRRFIQRVYATDKTYTGMELETKEFMLTFFYISASINHMEFVKAGELIGIAQDINAKWGDPMANHIHLQLAIKPYGAVIKGGTWNTQLIHINPLNFIDLEV